MAFESTPELEASGEDQQAPRILARLILIAWAAYFFVILLGRFYNDPKLVAVALVASLLQIIPFGLLRLRRIGASSLVFLLSVLGVVTAIATAGQGIRDLAVATFPIIFIFSSLTFNRVIFGVCVGLTLAAIGWLVFGEALGWFVTQPYNTPSWVDFLIVAVIMLVSAFAVDLLATNLRRSLRQARWEIMQRKRIEAQLRYQSTHDPLTEVYNRAFFDDELTRLETAAFPVSIVIADVDRLKATNDTQGHAAGDALLRRAARLLRAAFRTADVLARIGGDEFVVLLPATDAATAGHILTRVRAHLAEHNADHPEAPVHLSLGSATADHGHLIETFRLADQRMYADKAARSAGRLPRSATSQTEHL